MDSWRLGMEAWTVIGLRMPRLLAGNPAALAEAQLMVGEKIEAAAALQWMAMTGALGFTPGEAMRASVAHYRKGVGKNRRRLARR
ncbi:hypothetical protein BV96_02352 [Sphingomonas paucimobilis]|nr:hypothetical protein BV96_02352 [Sphingomonas paucimobilis]